MKALRSSLIIALMSSTAALAAAVLPTPPKLADLVGGYHALLYTNDEATGIPAGLVTIAVTNKGALTGKLTTDENKTYSFKSTLNYTDETAPIEGSRQGAARNVAVIKIARKPLPELSLDLVISDFSGDTPDTLEVTVTSTDTQPRVATTGFKLVTFGKNESSNAAGPYTIAFQQRSVPEGAPAGSGYAVGSIDAKGILKFTGKTGDGAAITGSFPGSKAKQYAVFLNPNKRTESFFGGKIGLTLRADNKFHMLPADEDGFDFAWKKKTLLPKTSDKSYPNGYGPLHVVVSMEPWTVPNKVPVSSLVGIEKPEIFDIFYEGVFPSGSHFKDLPIKAGLTTNDALRLAEGGPGNTDGAVPSLWAKKLTTKIDPKTGKFTATLKIQDSVTVSGKLKTIARNVLFEGVVLRVEASDSSDFVHGQIIVPALDKTDTITSSSFSFSSDFKVDPIYASAVATAGTYTATLMREENSVGDPYASGTPVKPTVQEPVVTFTISEDLQTLNFAGKVMTLYLDERATHDRLDYKAFTGLNGVQVLLYLNSVTKHVDGLFAKYQQGYNPVKLSAYDHKPGTVVKQ